MSKLWQKGYRLDAFMERFAVGRNHLLDRQLVNADCLASVAHAAMLKEMGILKGEEFMTLKEELLRIIHLNEAGRFVITIAQEDCHTAIENHLTGVLGEAGEKIHTARSRNDQVLAALRLYGRGFLLQFRGACLRLAGALVHFAEEQRDQPMPGRTHMQIAMPSSVGLWAGAYAEALLDDLFLLAAAYQLNNHCPLGSAASYGVSLPIKRELVAEALGFAGVQNNVLYVNNSRGKMESIILDGVEQVMLTLSKLAQDIILFSMPEFQYFTLAEALCTGSSLMPQKRNPDGLELIRARAAAVTAANQQIKSIIRALPSGYNGDFQETKPPFMHSLHIALDSVGAMELTVRTLVVNPEKLLAGFIPEIYATDRVLELVAAGTPFREAYRQVALDLDKLEGMDPGEAIRKKTHQGGTGNLGLDRVREELQNREEALTLEARRVADKVRQLAGEEVRLFNGEPADYGQLGAETAHPS